MYARGFGECGSNLNFKYEGKKWEIVWSLIGTPDDCPFQRKSYRQQNNRRPEDDTYQAIIDWINTWPRDLACCWRVVLLSLCKTWTSVKRIKYKIG